MDAGDRFAPKGPGVNLRDPRGPGSAGGSFHDKLWIQRRGAILNTPESGPDGDLSIVRCSSRKRLSLLKCDSGGANIRSSIRRQRRRILGRSPSCPCHLPRAQARTRVHVDGFNLNFHGGQWSSAQASRSWTSEEVVAISACALGKAQSPVDLTGGQWANLTLIEYYYGRTRIVVENTGHMIQMTPKSGNGIVVDGVSRAVAVPFPPPQ